MSPFRYEISTTIDVVSDPELAAGGPIREEEVPNLGDRRAHVRESQSDVATSGGLLECVVV
jgi:hypothetical protein